MTNGRDMVTAGRTATATGVRQRLNESVLPGAAVAAGAVTGLLAFEGGYFPTSWGWASAPLLLVIAGWAAWSGRAEMGRAELALVGFLAAFTAWVGLSIGWSAVPAQSVLELQRALVPLAGVIAFLLLARGVGITSFAAAILAAITIVCAYALGTRLFPDQLGEFATDGMYRLSQPVGYWNGLGILAVLGIMLALGLVADARHAVVRAGAAAATVALVTTLYFTFSRASWAVLGIGVAVMLLVTPRRLRALAYALAVGVPASIAVVFASQSFALTHRDAELARAVEDGRKLAVLLVALAAAAAGTALLVDAMEPRLAAVSRHRRVAAAVLVVCAVVVSSAAVASYGGPVELTEKAWSSFLTEQSIDNGGDLNRRLFTFSGNGRVELWEVAARMFADRPVQGNGAGTFERFWQAQPDASFKARDAHGLYIEVLAELGLVGLLSLAGALAIPLVVGFRSRGAPLVASALAGYLAFLVHAGVDWDWELSGIALTGLLIGSLPLLASRPGRRRAFGARSRALVVGVAVALGAEALVGVVGNGAIANARDAVARQDTDRALAESRRAQRLMPWSPRPWIVLGEAHLQDGHRAQAAASFRRALAIDDREWRAWAELALATDGPPSERALARARVLYPTNPDLAAIAEQRGLGSQ